MVASPENLWIRDAAYGTRIGAEEFAHWTAPTTFSRYTPMGPRSGKPQSLVMRMPFGNCTNFPKTLVTNCA
jgi:hypothetical protein